MLDRDYENQVCSIARSLEVVGERWSLLIVRNVGLGLNRFEPLRENLGITRSVLTTRLNTLIEYGILEKRQYSERPPRFEYHLTAKGRDLAPVLLQLMWWGDRYYPEENGAPSIATHGGCGGLLDHHLICEKCGEKVEPSDIKVKPGPGRKTEDLPKIPA
ncbi:MAG: helix-turn-helix transcriptional regulator [Solirubrobacterales bacterium]|nr:helix-turn-helix transcriptional regulator [Solirubrobacterales bacterium]